MCLPSPPPPQLLLPPYFDFAVISMYHRSVNKPSPLYTLNYLDFMRSRSNAIKSQSRCKKWCKLTVSLAHVVIRYSNFLSLLIALFAFSFIFSSQSTFSHHFTKIIRRFVKIFVSIELHITFIHHQNSDFTKIPLPSRRVICKFSFKNEWLNGNVEWYLPMYKWKIYRTYRSLYFISETFNDNK